MRGIRKLKDINSAVGPTQPVLVDPARDKNLYDEKVKVLTARYYYYQYLAKKRTYEDILTILENEFHISSRRIVDIINRQIPTIQELKKLAPARDWFKQQWGHFTW
jgi:hypothetical protein